MYSAGCLSRQTCYLQLTSLEKQKNTVPYSTYLPQGPVESRMQVRTRSNQNKALILCCVTLCICTIPDNYNQHPHTLAYCNAFLISI